jgi:hypothetical protein
MKKIFIPFSLFFSIYTYSQVGINTETPKATLDVTATGSLTTPDGILIPRISKLRAKNMVNTEPTTLVYINELNDDSNSGSTINVNSTGFYYFNGNQWIKLISGNTDSNIYNTDGTLTGDRVVNQDTYKLAFTSEPTSGTNHFSVDGSTLSVDAFNNRVGIGTIDPESKLHVKGDLQFNGSLKVGGNGNSGTANQILTSNGTNNPPTFSDLDTNSSSALLFNNGIKENPNSPNNIQLGGPLIQDTTIDLNTNQLTFTSTNTSENNSAFVIKKATTTNPLFYTDLKNGRVGINTNTPQHQLDINGNLYLRYGLFVGTNNGNTSTNGSAGSAGQFLRSNGANKSPEWVSVSTSGNTIYTFNNGLQETPNIENNIELGGILVQDTEINTNGNTFSITGDTKNAFNLKATDNTIVLSTDLANNNVGIGTQSPEKALDINGDLRIRTVNPSTPNSQILTITKDGTVQKMDSNSGTYFLGGTIYAIKGNNNGGNLNDQYIINEYISGYPGIKGGINSIKGKGYKVSNPVNGLFIIQFNKPYTTIYGVSLNIVDAYTNSSNLPNSDYAGLSLDTRDNTQISFVSNNYIIVKTGPNSISNRSFSFLVIGQ